MNPNSIYRSLIESGTHWANAHAEASQLENQLKPMLSSLTVEARSLEKCSMVEAKDIAQSASVYRDAITAAVRSRQASNIAKVTYDATMSLFQAQRTVEATERAASGAQT